MKVQVRLNNYRRSARKVREIISIIKGLDIVQAENQLNVLRNGSADDLKKLLLSAVAAAKNNFNLQEDNLFVSNVIVQEGKTMKRWRARAYGRANQILKRSCHILLTVEEKQIGKEDKLTEKANKIKKKDSKESIKKDAKEEKKNLRERNQDKQEKKVIDKK